MLGGAGRLIELGLGHLLLNVFVVVNEVHCLKEAILLQKVAFRRKASLKGFVNRVREGMSFANLSD